MNHCKIALAALSLAILVGCKPDQAPQAPPTPSQAIQAFATPVQVRPLEEYLQQGRLGEGTQGLAYQVSQQPDDEQLRLSLGVVQFLRALEGLAQGLYRYGLLSSRAEGIPFLRLPVPENRQAAAVTYADVRKLFEDLVVDLTAAEATFARVQDPQVKLKVELGSIRFDLDGDGKADAPLLDIAAQYLGGKSRLPKDPLLVTAFDASDATWFRGYCHLLMAQSQVVLTYDGQEIFDGTSHIFFARPDTPYAFLQKVDGKDFWHLGNGVDGVDAIALIHLLRLPVKEKHRGALALGHLEQVIALSRETWKQIQAETDNDREWLPGPRQDGVLGVKVTPEIVTGWHEFLDESELILQGKKLLPFWRSGEKRGVNLRRVFLEPAPFDLVLWFQGTAALPYLEEGPQTSRETWSRLSGVFRGQFLGFALWFN